MLCNPVLVTRLQDRSVDREEVIAPVTVHGRLVLVDVDIASLIWRDSRWISPKSSEELSVYSVSVQE